MLPGEMSDEQLMLLYQNGTEEAFRELYSRHSPKILGFITKRIRNQEQSIDIFQEVFIKIHKSKHLYKKNLPVLPWIFTITKNTIVDVVRKSKYTTKQVQLDEVNLAAPEIQQQEGALPLQLQQLSENQKSAIHLRYVEEKTFEEIAGILGTSDVNIRKLISRGISRLKEIMEGEKP